MLMLLSAFVAVCAFGKEIRTLVVTTEPQMHCAACEKRIKDNIRFEKGVKKIATSIENQTVTIQYDADKNSLENLLKAFEKFGYTARKVEADAKIPLNPAEECPLMPMK